MPKLIYETERSLRKVIESTLKNDPEFQKWNKQFPPEKQMEVTWVANLETVKISVAVQA